MDTCKICGAARDPMASSCKFCGTTYALEKLTGEVYVSALQQVLTRIDDEESKKGGNDDRATKRKATAISTFAVPADIENLLQFFAFCHGNAQAGGSSRYSDDERDAWHGKAQMAFAQLKMKAVTNPSLASYIAEYGPLYSVGAMRKKDFVTNLTMWALLFLLICCVCIGTCNQGEPTEKARLESVIQKVQGFIASEQYDAAEASCIDIHWTQNLNYDSSKEMVKAYDKKREDLMALIAEARKKARK
jgi:hypothetical protein